MSYDNNDDDGADKQMKENHPIADKVVPCILISFWYSREFSSLHDRAIRTVGGSRLGDDDAVAGLHIQVVSSIFLVDTVVPKDGDKLDLLAGVPLGGAVGVLGGGEGHGGQGGEDHLRTIRKKIV